MDFTNKCFYTLLRDSLLLICRGSDILRGLIFLATLRVGTTYIWHSFFIKIPQNHNFSAFSAKLRIQNFSRGGGTFLVGLKPPEIINLSRLCYVLVGVTKLMEMFQGIDGLKGLDAIDQIGGPEKLMEMLQAQTG